MTPATRCLVATGVWSARLLGLAVMVVALAEVVQVGLCVWEERRNG